MKREQAKANFAQTAILLADKYGVKLTIDWDRAVLDFHGELEGYQWDILIGELTKLAKEMGVYDEKICAWL